MTIAEMLGQSGVLTLLGMSVVFGFLAIMIICVALTGKLIHALGADKDVMQSAAPAPAPVGKTTDAGAVTAAIVAAVAEHQKNNS
ncbi:MAG: OadG family protein [Treponema sp.]|jgi:oxaloacetate decarboxylase gamma subunit|nr:OadG family protein [Treponema sp.]